MSENRYRQGILHAYCGEVRGEASFLQMAADESDATARRMWLKIAEVETRTRQAMESLAQRLHPDMQNEVAQARAEGLQRAQARKSLSWRQIAESYEPQLPGFLARFEALEAEAPIEDQAIAAQLSEHSRAFGDCIRTWLTGDAEAATAHLQRYLDTYSRG